MVEGHIFGLFKAKYIRKAPRVLFWPSYYQGDNPMVTHFPNHPDIITEDLSSCYITIYRIK